MLVFAVTFSVFLCFFPFASLTFASLIFLLTFVIFGTTFAFFRCLFGGAFLAIDLGVSSLHFCVFRALRTRRVGTEGGDLTGKDESEKRADAGIMPRLDVLLEVRAVTCKEKQLKVGLPSSKQLLVGVTSRDWTAFPWRCREKQEGAGLTGEQVDEEMGETEIGLGERQYFLLRLLSVRAVA